MQSQPVRAEVTKRSSSTRSRVSNGSLFVCDVDGRSAEARRFRDLLAEIASDLGGLDHLSEGQKQIARRCALLSVECEKLEAKSVAGEEIDLNTYGMLVDRLGRAFDRIGIKRQPRDVRPPTLGDIAVRLHAAREAQHADP